MVTDHQLSIRGGGERTNFLASATYNKNNGIFKDEDYERYSIRLNLNHEINKYVRSERRHNIHMLPSSVEPDLPVAGA